MIGVINKGLSNYISISEIGHKSINSSIQILGNHNKVIIELGCSFSNMKIIIRGNNNKLVIKRHSLFQGGR